MNPDPHARLLELDAACRNVTMAVDALKRRGERATADDFGHARREILRALMSDCPSCRGEPVTAGGGA